MIKQIVHLFFILVLGITVSAQKKLPSYGDIDMAELAMTSCSFEPAASAMKILDVTETDFRLFLSGGSKMKIEQRVRIKIFNEKGYEYANVRIPYINKRGIGKIKELKGIIYSMDGSGKITKETLEKEDFFKQTVVENMGMVSFTFPNLKPGSIVEYSYTRVENDIYHIDPWIIQSEIPVQYSSFRLSVPSSSVLKEKLFGSDTVDVKTELPRYERPMNKLYFKENIPSFKPEPFMSSEKDNLMKMVFFHIPSNNPYFAASADFMSLWSQSGRYFLREKIDSQLLKTLPGSEVIIDSAKKIGSIPDRIKYIYTSVKKQVPQKTDQSYMPKDVVETWNNHSGNTADINLILINLLRKANVTCYPLLVSTRDHGLISKDFPSFGQLNGIDVVAMTDSVNYYLMDASLKFQSVNTPPMNILNREALLLRPGHINWFLVSDGRKLLKQSMNLFCEFKETGILYGQASLQHYYYSKSYMLDSALKKEEEKKNKKYFDKKTPGLTILSTTQEITEDDDDPLYESVSFQYLLPQTENFYFLNPQFLTPQNSNPFIADKRNTDIDLICNQQTLISTTISLPASFEVDHLPKNIIVRAPDSSFYYKRSYFVSGSNLSLTQIFEINRATFFKDDYAGIKEFFSRIYALMNEEIVLKKKN